MVTGAALEVVAGNAVGTKVIVEDEFIVGREADGAGQLGNDEEISRMHARITLDGSGYLAIEDLGSTNGTFVNGLRISGPTTLVVGDGIELGGTTLVVRELPIPVTSEAPLPPLALRVEIDTAGRETRILLDDVSEPVRLKHAEGAWHVVPPE
jgi:pSer/pThr/pTyr-binding forkhead associated (FHA) protein